MENSSKIFKDGIRPPGRIDRVSQLREDWRAARVAHRDLQLMRTPRVNLLLVGTNGVIQNVLDMLLPNLCAPIKTWRLAEHPSLPVAPVGAMILREVGALPVDDQHRLLEWMDLTGGRTQIVSTTSTPLLSRVRAGEFLEALYYRLNTV